MFRARLPIFSTSHKMPHLPRNLHRVATWRSPDNAIRKKNTRRDTSKVPCLPREMTMEVAKALRLPQRKKTTFDTVWNMLEDIKRHACHAKRGYATSETSKSDRCCKTRHRHGHSDLTRTVANGCGRKRNVERTHPQPPDPQSETGTLATHSGRNFWGTSPKFPKSCWKVARELLGAPKMIGTSS